MERERWKAEICLQTWQEFCVCGRNPWELERCPPDGAPEQEETVKDGDWAFKERTRGCRQFELARGGGGGAERKRAE